MNYLIDNHNFLWFFSGADELSNQAKIQIEDNHNQIYISIASLWDISIKTALGKLSIKGNYASVIDDVIENNIDILSINFQHTVIQNQLPFYHRDPFDRIIIAQAISEGMDLISNDGAFDPYFKNLLMKRIW